MFLSELLEEHSAAAPAWVYENWQITAEQILKRQALKEDVWEESGKRDFSMKWKVILSGGL